MLNRDIALQRSRIIKRKTDPGQYYLFLVWPFLTILLAIRNFRTHWAMNVFWLYSIYFGFTFVIISAEVDASDYAAQLVSFAHSDISLSKLFSGYLSEDGNLDIVQALLTYIVSFFTDDYRYLFAIFGLFMGYFISRYVWMIIKKINIRMDFFAGLLLISYALVIGIWDIGGVRWSVAAAMFFFSILNYFESDNKNFLWITLSTIFVHWSFTLALIVLLVYFIFGNRTRMYFLLFVFSFIISEIDLDIVRDYFGNYAPTVVQETRGSYLNQGYVDLISNAWQDNSWYLIYHLQLLKWFILLSVSYIYISMRRKETLSHTLYNRLFNLGLLFYGTFNILSTIPSVFRFLNIGYLIFLSTFILYITSLKNKFPLWLKIVGIPVLLLYIVVRIRIGFDYIGVWSVIGNPILAFFVENDLPLIDLVKSLL